MHLVEPSYSRGISTINEASIASDLKLNLIELSRLTNISEKDLLGDHPKQILKRLKPLDTLLLSSIVDIFQSIGEHYQSLKAERSAQDAFKKALLILQFIESENAYYSQKRMNHLQQLKNILLLSPLNIARF